MVGRLAALVLATGLAYGGDQPGRALLEQHGIRPDAESIGAYLRSHYADEALRAEIRAWIADLASPDQDTRIVAARKLQRTGVASLDQLRAAMRSADPEVRRRARRLSAEATQAMRHDVLIACFRIIESDQLGGLAAETLATLPLCITQSMRVAAAGALRATSGPQDAALLLGALHEPGAVIAYGRLVGPQSARLLRRLGHEAADPVRIAAARALADQEDRACLALLGDLLASDHAWVRLWAAQTLRHLSGETFGFASQDAARFRAPAMRQWREWIRAHETNASWKTPLPRPPVLLGRTLVTLWTDEKIVEFDDAGNIIWEVSPIKGPWACRGLPNGHRLVAFHKKREVVEYDAHGKVCWTHEKLPGSPTSVERLPNGNTLIACRQMMEVTPQHRVLWSIRLPGGISDARSLGNGHYLVTLSRGGRVVEIDRHKKVYWELADLGEPVCAQPLANGNVLICFPKQGSVVEYDRKGKIVWSRAGLAWSNCAQRLPNGNTLITDRNSVREVDRNGVTRWGKPLTGYKCAWRY